MHALVVVCSSPDGLGPPLVKPCWSEATFAGCSSPSFLDKLTVHVAKNFLELPKIKVPLILGIWGGKGQGKTFQCTLAYKKLGINPVVMSAGELESGNAGEPAKLIRQRYRSVTIYLSALSANSHQNVTDLSLWESAVVIVGISSTSACCYQCIEAWASITLSNCAMVDSCASSTTCRLYSRFLSPKSGCHDA